MTRLNILITGCCGLIGSKFFKWLVNNTDHNITGIDDLSGGYKENLDGIDFTDYCIDCVEPNPRRIVWYKHDIKDLDTLKLIFKHEQFDLVFHMAAWAAECASPFARKFNYENNIIASANLITCAIEYNIKYFQFLSSMSRYGHKYTAPFHESLPPAPADPYAIAKVAVEQDLEVAYKQHGLNYTIIVPHNVVSEGVNMWDRYRNVLGIWARQLLENKQPTIYGNGQQKRAFTDTNDILPCLWKAYENKNAHREIINLGGMTEISIEKACRMMIDVSNKSIEPIYLQSRFEAKNAWATWEKSVNLLDFYHKTPLRDTMENLYDWANIEYYKREPKMFNGPFELKKGLYEYWK